MSTTPDAAGAQASRARRPRLRARSWVLIFLAFGLFVSFLPRAPQHDVVRRVVIAVLQKQTGREIRVGSVEGVLWFGVAVHDVSLSDEGGFGADGQAVQFSVKRIVLRYSLWRMIVSRGDVAGGLGSIDVLDPQGRINRLADGKIDLVEMFRPPKTEKPSTFAARVTVRGGTLHLIDQVVASPVTGAPWHHRIEHGVTALRFHAADPVELQQAELRLAPTDTPALLSELRLTGVEIAPDPLGIEGRLRLDRIDLGLLQAYLAPYAGDRATLLGGILDCDGAVTFRAPRAEGDQPQISLDATLAAQDLALAAAQLGMPVKGITGRAVLDVTLGADGSRDGTIRLEGLRAEAGGSAVIVDGTVDGLTDPRLSLHLDVPRWRAGELARLLVTVPALRPLQSTGTSRAELRLRGRLAGLAVSGWFEPSDVAWGEQARLVRGRMSFDLRRTAPGASPFGVEGRLAFDGLDATSARLGEPIHDLRGELRLAGSTVVLSGLRAGLGSATLRADGRVANLDGPPYRLALAVQFDGLSPMAVAPLVPAEFRPRASRGLASGRLRLEGEPATLAVAGDLRLPEIALPQGRHLGGRYGLDVRLGGRPTGTVRLADAGFDLDRLCAPVTGVHGTVRLGPAGLTLGDLRLRYGGSPVRADGTVGWDAGRFDLSVWTPGVEMADLACVIGRADIAGRGPLRLDVRLRGTPRRVAVTGAIGVPRLRVPGVRIDRAAVTCDLAIEPARGAAGLTGWLSVRDAALLADAAPAPVAGLSGRFRFEGERLLLTRVAAKVNGDPITAQGLVRGLPNVAALDLNVTTTGLRDATLRRLARGVDGLDGFRLVQPLRADLVLRGSLEKLVIRGPVAAPQVALGPRPRTTVGARAVLDVTYLAGQRLPVEGTVTLHEGFAATPRFGLPAHDIEGRLRLHRDGRIAIVEGSELDAMAGLLGDAATPFRLRGEVTVGEETLLDLAVDLQRLTIDELRQAAATLENPPEIEGRGELRIQGLRILGSTSRLHITTGEGAAAGWIGLPERLAARGYELAGGRARADLVVAEGALETARIDLFEAGLGIASTGTRVAELTGSMTLEGRRLTAELDGRIGGRAVRVEPRDSPVAPPPDGPLRVDLRVRSRDVPLFDLLPSLDGLRETLEADRISSDLAVYGPVDDLTIGGQVLLAGGPSGVAPLRLDVMLRSVSADDGVPEIFGGVRFNGGGLPLARLDRPLSNIRGAVSVSTRDVLIEELTANLGPGQIVARGSVFGFPETRFDLALEVRDLDLGAMLSELRVDDPEDPGGPPVDFYTARGLPPLRTPEPVTGTITLRGPREAVGVGLSLNVPMVTVAPFRAITDDRGLGAGDPLFERRGGVLMTGTRLSGSAIGSLESAPLPEAGEAVAALERLTGFQLVAASPPPPAPPAPPKPSLLESFSLALHLETDSLDVRQVVAFLSEKAQSETLRTLYAHQPGRLAVDVLGPATSPELVGSIELPRIEYYGVPMRRLALDFDLFDQVFSFTQGIIDIRGGQLRSSGAVAIRAGRPIDVAADVEVDNIELAVLNAMGLEALEGREVDGLLDGRLTVHLADEIPRVAGRLDVRGLSVNDTPLGDGVADFALEDQLLVLREARLSEAGTHSHVDLRGRVALAGDGQLDLATDVQNLDLGGLAPLIPGLGPEDLSGRLDFAGHVGGSRNFPLLLGAGAVRFGSIRGYSFARLSLDATQYGPNGMLAALELSDPAYQARATARLEDIDFATGAARVTARVEDLNIDLARALPLVLENPLLADSSGRVAGEATVTGRLVGRPPEGEPEDERPSTLSTLRGEFALTAGDPERPRRLRLAGRTFDLARFSGTIGDNSLDLAELEVHAGQTRIGLDPERPSRIDDLSGRRTCDLHVVSDQLYYDDLVALTRLPLQTEGYVRLAADVSGELADPSVEARLETRGLVINGEPVPDRVVTARAGRDWFGFDGQQRFDLFGCGLVVDGGTFDETVRLNADLEVVDFERLRRFLAAVAKPRDDAQATAWQASLASLVETMPATFAGRIQSRLQLSGTPSRPLGDWTFEASGLEAGEEHKPLPDLRAAVAIGRPVTPEVGEPQAETLYVFGNVDLRLDEVTGRRDGILRLQATSGPIDLARYQSWSPSAEGLNGGLSLQATATGRLSSPRLEILDLSLTDVHARGLEISRLGIANLVYTKDELDLGQVTLANHGMRGELTGRLPLGGTAPPKAVGLEALLARLRRGAPLEAHLQLAAADAGELAPALPAVGSMTGEAAIDLTLSGTVDEPLIDGRVSADLPRIVLVKPAEGGGSPPGEAEETAELVDTGLDLRIDDNLVQVARAETALAGDPGRPNGRLRIVPDGTVELRYLTPDRLFENRIDLRLEAQDLALRQPSLQVADLNLSLALEPADALAPEARQASWLARLAIDRADGWVNGGYVAAAGEVGIRSPDPRQWQDNAYQMRFGTPLITDGDVTAPEFPERFRPRPTERAGGRLYPVHFERGGAGEVNLGLDLALETRAGQTPPLTLSGQADLFGATLREGLIGLFGRGGGEATPQAAWPATPQLDVLVTAEEDNWIHMRVPQVDLPVTARVRASGTPQQLRLDGTAGLGEGGVSASVLKSQVRVRSGEARFTVRRDPSSGVFEPFASYRATATTTVREVGEDRPEIYDVTLEARGAVRPGAKKPIDTDFQLSATSSPSLPEARILELISRRAEFAEAMESGRVESFVREELANAAIQAALGVALSPLLEEFREALGLDVLRLEYNVNGQLDLEAGQYLDPADRIFARVLVEVGGAESSRQTFKVDYRIGRGVSVGAQYDSLGEFRGTTEYTAEF